MYEIFFTPEAIEDIDAIRKFDASRIIQEVEEQLKSEPEISTRNRKQLRPNPLAQWELRLGDFRVFYDVNVVDSIVRVVAVGRKTGNQLFIHGERYDL